MLRPFVYNPPLKPLEIIYIDSSVVVLNKPAGLLTVAGRPENHSDCLLTRVRKKVFGALLVHRLDLDTSGIIIFARTTSSQVNLGHQFEERRTKKIYRAKVSGHIKKDTGLINLPIVVDWPNRPIQKVCFEKHKFRACKDLEQTWFSPFLDICFCSNICKIVNLLYMFFDCVIAIVQ